MAHQKDNTLEVYQLKDMSKAISDPRVDTLLQTIEPFFIRIKKSDLGIPQATEHEPIIVPMGETQRRIYDVIEKKYMNDIVSSKDNWFRQDLVKARLLRMMQAATNPSLLSMPLKNFASFEGFDPNAVSEDTSLISDVLQYAKLETPAKFIKARELIEQIVADGGKVVVWAIYIKTYLILKSTCFHVESHVKRCMVLLQLLRVMKMKMKLKPERKS